MKRRLRIQRYDDLLAAADGDYRNTKAIAHVDINQCLANPWRRDQRFIDAVFVGKIKVIDDAARNQRTRKAHACFMFRQHYFVRAGFFQKPCVQAVRSFGNYEGSALFLYKHCCKNGGADVIAHADYNTIEIAYPDALECAFIRGIRNNGMGYMIRYRGNAPFIAVDR